MDVNYGVVRHVHLMTDPRPNPESSTPVHTESRKNAHTRSDRRLVGRREVVPTKTHNIFRMAEGEPRGKVALITGITGQDGSYLTEFLLEKGYTVRCRFVCFASLPLPCWLARVCVDEDPFGSSVFLSLTG
jgi:GDP-mannose 4,6 dehydratase